MAEYKLTLEKREITGKKLKSLRASGLIPSVVYGGKEPVLLSSEYVATEKVLTEAGYHSPIDLDMAGTKQLAIVKDVAIDPVSRKILNVEFQAISAAKKVEATTPVVVVGFDESEASKIYHFALTQSIEELDVKAKPADLPKELTVDASGLKDVDDKLTIANIVLPNGVSASSIAVGQDGSLSYKNAKGVYVDMNQSIGLFQFNNPSGLNKVGDNLLAVTDASGAALNESTNATLTASQVRQGFLESSNVQVSNEMVNLIIAQRAYQLNSKAITTSDEMLEQANNLKR